jgi:hypothetical protein
MAAVLRRMEAAQDSWTRHKLIRYKTLIDAAEGRKLQQSPAGVIEAPLAYADPVQLNQDSNSLLPGLGHPWAIAYHDRRNNRQCYLLNTKAVIE